MDLELTDKVAIVTGGSRGIGKAIARQLAREGVDVAICARNEGPLNAAAEELGAETERRFLAVPADMRKLDDIQRLVQRTADTFGRVDILINNAAQIGGTQGPDDITNVSDELIINDFETKMLGYVRCAREVVSYMERQGWGRMVLVSGMATRMAGGVSGGMRNAAVTNLGKALSNQLGPKGITVNVIQPGAVGSETLQERLETVARRQGTTVDQARQRMAQGNAIRHIVTPEEIANVVAFLCSPRAHSITGESISVSGGTGGGVFY